MTQHVTAWPKGAPQVGQKAERSRTVTSRDIELFTEISGDRNPIHYDEACARATPFGCIVVQGGVTSAVTRASISLSAQGDRPCSAGAALARASSMGWSP